MVDITEAYKANNHNNFVNWLIIAIIAKQFPNGDLPEELMQKPENLTMQFNGVELDPLLGLKRLEESFDDEVKKAAKEMLEELKKDLMNKLDDKFTILTDGLQQLIDDTLPEEYRREDEWS